MAREGEMIVGLIPARAGSRGIVAKNTRLLGGRSLIAWAASAALASECLDEIFVSTESDAIARLGRQCGMGILMRPARLADDHTPMQQVITHALDKLEWEHVTIPKIMVLLQPTSPFRNPVRINEAVGMLQRTNADCVMTVEKIPDHYNPGFAWAMVDDKIAPWDSTDPPVCRQYLTPAYSRDGGVYAFSVESFRRNKNIYGDDCRGIVVPPAEACNLDEESDWLDAERRLRG